MPNQLYIVVPQQYFRSLMEVKVLWAICQRWLDLTPLLVSEASRVQLPLQLTPLATCFSTSCVDGRGSSLIPTVWNKEFTESAQDYMSRTNLSVKVLDFVQLGGSNSTLVMVPRLTSAAVRAVEPATACTDRDSL